MVFAWYIVSTIVDSVISIMLLLFFIRAILSWVSHMPSSNIEILLYKVTDFVIDPIRKVLSRFEFVRRCPIDISFTAAMLLLCLLRYLI